MLGFNITRSRKVLILAAPIIIAMFTQTAINVVDTIFVGKLDPSFSIPGQSALGFSLPLLWAIGGFLSSIGIGTQAMVARRFGANQNLDAGIVISNSLIVAVLSSIIFTILGWIAVPYFFEFITKNESVTALGIPYARIRILGVTAMVGTASLKGFFDGIGKTRVHMYAAIVMNIFNIVLNYVFIFGFGSIEPYYVTGAAIASLISTYIGVLVMVLWSLKGKYYKPHRYYRPKNINPKMMWEISKLSIPSGLATVFVMSGVLLFLKIIGLLDEMAIADQLGQVALFTEHMPYLTFQHSLLSLPTESLNGIGFVHNQVHAISQSAPPIYTTAAKLIIDLLTIGFVTTIALGTATATLVSQSMGEGNLQAAEDYGWDSVKIGAVFFGSFGLLMILFPEFFLSALSNDQSVISAAIPGLQIMASLEIFIATSLILTQALFGAGATRFVMWTELILHGLCLAPLAWLLAIYFELGFNGIWMSASVYILLLSGTMAWKFWSGTWKSIEV